MFSSCDVPQFLCYFLFNKESISTAFLKLMDNPGLASAGCKTIQLLGQLLLDGGCSKQTRIELLLLQDITEKWALFRGGFAKIITWFW